jgi:hypothetical protein
MFSGILHKKMMKAGAVFLLFITAFLLCACGSSASRKNKENIGMEQENPYKERYIVSWLTGSETSSEYEGDQWDERLLEELFNVDIRIWRVSPTVDGQYRFLQYLNAGDLPDVGFYGSLVSREAEYSKETLYEKGFIGAIPIEVLRTYLPSVYKLYEDNPLYYSYCKINDQELYSLPIIAVNNRYPRYIGLFHYEWLKNIGFEFENLFECRFPDTPVYDSYRGRLLYASNKLSVEQFTEILHKLTFDDPDRNGLDDTFGMYMEDEFDRIGRDLFGFPLQYAHMMFDEKTEKCVPSFAVDTNKEMLNWQLNGVRDGYLVMKGINSSEKPDPKSGRYGYFRVQFADLFTNIQTVSSVPNVFNQSTITAAPWERHPLISNGKEKYVVMPVPGEKGGFSAYDYSLYVKGNEYVFARMEEDKRNRILSMLEYAFFGSEKNTFLFGIENVHFQWSGEPYKSVPIYKNPRMLEEPYTADSNPGHLGNLYFRTDPLHLFRYESSIAAFYQYFFTYYHYNDLFITPYKDINFDELLDNVFGGDIKRYNALSQTYFDIVRNVFRVPIIDIDKEFDQYKKALLGNPDFIKLLEYINDDRFLVYNDVLILEDEGRR